MGVIEAVHDLGPLLRGQTEGSHQGVRLGLVGAESFQFLGAREHATDRGGQLAGVEGEVDGHLEELSVELVEALLSSGIIAVLVALVFFYLIPTVPQETPAPAAPAAAFKLNNAQAAFISTAVIWPLLALYFTFS